ncbi:hypothetical protein AYI70_g9107 [Smittium culicis]|uniref:Uncharacterized protein n=1 Tax=Smittium culicis TaxID=133412 RepID=A0A1R1XCV3_9FUNG|nr:hypothetical protein AYI70_g9107 [Smittium culicis]
MIGRLLKKSSTNQEAKERYIKEMKANENEVIKIKKEKLNGVIIRSKANWSEKNEKSNKYFYGLLKTRKKTTLFRKNLVLASSQSTLLSNIESKLNEAEIYSLDKKIDKTEIMNVFEESPNNKSSGPDGLCFEF